MADITKELLSGTPGGGRGVKVVATATPGTTVHDTGTGTVNSDEVWIFASHKHTAVITVTVEFGGTTDPDDLIVMEIPPNVGLVPIVHGLILRGSGSARSIKAFASVANKVTLHGYVNRIVP
jgi:hypothetical protein